MAFHPTDLVGYGAAFLTTVSFVPQDWLTVRSRNVSGISLGMYALFTVGVALWLIYGVIQRSWPLVGANAVTFLLALTVLVMRLRYGPRRGP
ncbi:MAG: SemiSWEET transporter [Burkholderiaceae bacterium]|nr:SemiSWEET transporter [Burkholderiaceae bacterium]